MNRLGGVWLPIITPFKNDSIDYDSYRKLIDYYIPKGIAGIIPNGTTGESPTLDDFEFEELLEKTMEYTNGRVPVYYGVGGNNTAKVIRAVKVAEKYNADGILSVSPYYSRPDQHGIYEHYRALSESTPLKIIVYNIPYRTGRNVENDTLLKLACLENIVGVKDSCGSISQTMELLASRPENFSVLTGEDILFYVSLALGGDGGILASSHIETEKFISVMNSMSANDHFNALKTWESVRSFIPLLFKEPNPAPIKYCLAEKGLIKSAAVRLPLTEITQGLKNELDAYI